MKIEGNRRGNPVVAAIVDQCEALDLRVHVLGVSRDSIKLVGPADEPISISFDGRISMIEQLLRQLRFRLGELPLLTRGESKEIRLLTPRIALAKFISDSLLVHTPSLWYSPRYRRGSSPLQC